MLELNSKLLSIGGLALVAPTKAEPKLDDLLKRASVFVPAKREWMKMAKSACHWNASYLWQMPNSTFEIGTGYALSPDGLWRQHSWVMDGDTLVETTEPRRIYFGILLNAEEAKDFADCNGPKKKS